MRLPLFSLALAVALAVSLVAAPQVTRTMPVEEIRPGDIVWFEPGEKHWHGASAEVAMSHLAIAEALDGKVVDWLEHVTDEQYRGTA